jgi:hypothetical protein
MRVGGEGEEGKEDFEGKGGNEIGLAPNTHIVSKGRCVGLSATISSLPYQDERQLLLELARV